MRFSVLASGSKANCTFIEAEGFRILIDCGLSCRAVCQRLVQHGIDPHSLDAILVTHEHSDHVRGLKQMQKKLGMPIYTNRATARHLRDLPVIERFKTGDAFELGPFSVLPFSISHDAADPVGFSIQNGPNKLVHVTDLGRLTQAVVDATEYANALILEFNHCSQMLMDCHYPWELKQRISSTHGHLSNDVASGFLNDVLHPELKFLVLAHISENSNTPQLALQAAQAALGSQALRGLVCGSPYASAPLFDLASEIAVSPLASANEAA